ncbi:MAG: NAD-dependent epimerase/dehydratase family protein [Chloroflexota bacterium]
MIRRRPLILVTGSSGHIGANLVRALLQRGNSVRALVHVDETALQGLDVETVRGDITDESSLVPVLHGVDVLYHSAAYVSVSGSERETMWQRNVEGTRNIVRGCIRNGVTRLIHFSSIHAIADVGAEAVIDEESPLVTGRGAAPYDRSKAESERIVLNAAREGLNAVVVAPTAVLGPHDYRPSHFGRVLLALARGHMPVIVEGGYDWVDVRDVVDGAIASADDAPAGSKFMLSGNWCSFSTIAQLIGEVRGCRSPRVCLPSRVAQATGTLNEAFCRARGIEALFTRYSVGALSSHRNVSHDKATRELGYKPRALRETIADTLRWFEVSGYLTSCQSGNET